MGNRSSHASVMLSLYASCPVFSDQPHDQICYCRFDIYIGCNVNSFEPKSTEYFPQKGNNFQINPNQLISIRFLKPIFQSIRQFKSVYLILFVSCNLLRLSYSCILFQEKNQAEIELPGKKHDEMVELLKCIYPPHRGRITGVYDALKQK